MAAGRVRLSFADVSASAGVEGCCGGIRGEGIIQGGCDGRCFGWTVASVSDAEHSELDVWPSDRRGPQAATSKNRRVTRV